MTSVASVASVEFENQIQGAASVETNGASAKHHPPEKKKMVYVEKSKPNPVMRASGAELPVLLPGVLSKAAGRIVDESTNKEMGLISEAEPDSSDTLSTEEGEIFEDDFIISEEEHEYLEVVSKRDRRNYRGNGSKIH